MSAACPASSSTSFISASFLAQLALELVAHIDAHAGRRSLELMIAAHAIRDRGFVDRLGVARLARFNPTAEIASDQFEKP